VEGMIVMEEAKTVVKQLICECQDIPNYEERMMRTSHYNRMNNYNTLKRILASCKFVFPLSINEFDTNNGLFNCQNGTLDLTSMQFREHNPDDMLGKVSGVTYDPKARCARFEQFITEIMQNDNELAKFLQKILGYSLSGNTNLECFFILYGNTTRNGKGTLMETMLKVMGDYGSAAKPETIRAMRQKSGSAPNEDIARLKDIRFVNMSEPDRGLIIDSALVKTLTGQDTYPARKLYQNSFNLVPKFKIFINTNYLPSIEDDTLFSSGRVIVIPFDHHFEDGEQDKNLKMLFAQPENLSGILNWTLDGLRMLREEGFSIPQKVKDATASYREDSDDIGNFVNDCLVPNTKARINRTDVYHAYETWSKENSCCVLNAKSFYNELYRIVKHLNSNGTRWILDYTFKA